MEQDRPIVHARSGPNVNSVVLVSNNNYSLGNLSEGIGIAAIHSPISSGNPVLLVGGSKAAEGTMEDSRLMEKMMDFTRQRDAHRKRLLTELMIINMTFGAVGSLVYLILLRFPSSLLLEVIKSILIVPSMICIYVIYFIPLDILNFNNESNVPWGFRILVFVASLMLSMATPQELNALSFLRIAIGISALFRGVGLKLTADKLTLLQVVHIPAMAASYLYIGISSLLWIEEQHYPLIATSLLGAPRSSGVGSYDASSIVVGIGFLLTFYFQLRGLLYAKKSGLCPTSTLHLVTFIFAAGIAFSFMVFAISEIYAKKYSDSVSKGMKSMTDWFIVFLYFVVGPKRVFAALSRFTTELFFRLYDRKEENRVRDGAFLIELREGLSTDEGDVWWVHHAKCGREPRMQYSDHRRYWYEGRVTQKSAVSMEVQLVEGTRSTLHYALTPSIQHASSEDLIRYARSHLRCIDWETIAAASTGDLTTSVRQMDPASLYALSRPLREGERVSFFISHSWSDNGTLKFKAMSRVANEYFLTHGRYPTFWFDKVCFDQKNIMDGLRLLPLNIMMCERMLVLYGETFSTRLWCIW